MPSSAFTNPSHMVCFLLSFKIKILFIHYKVVGPLTITPMVLPKTEAKTW